MREELKKRFSGLCCIEISGEGCANCLSLMPVLYKVVSARKDLRLMHVEVNDENRALIEHWEIDRVPSVLLAEDGEVFARCHGFQPEEILELWIDAKIEEHLN